MIEPEEVQSIRIGPMYQHGHLSIESPEVIQRLNLADCEFGVQIGEDGRVWVCVNGIAFLRFKPTPKGAAHQHPHMVDLPIDASSRATCSEPAASVAGSARRASMSPVLVRSASSTSLPTVRAAGTARPTMARTFVNGKVYVRRTQCETCVFRPGNLMRLSPGRLEGMIVDATRNDDGCIPCHHHLYEGQAVEPSVAASTIVTPRCRSGWLR